MDDILLSKLEAIPEWGLNAKHHLERVFKFADFMGAIEFANDVALVAEKHGHHPDLHISFGKCVVEIWTHDKNGLTDKDFALVQEIDHIHRA